MDTYYIDISGAFTVEETTTEVRNEETGFFSWFKDCVVTTNRERVVMNRAEFKEDNNRPVPSALMLVIEGGKPPEGLAKFWTGSMVVQGKIETVHGYR